MREKATSSFKRLKLNRFIQVSAFPLKVKKERNEIQRRGGKEKKRKMSTEIDRSIEATKTTIQRASSFTCNKISPKSETPWHT